MPNPVNLAGFPAVLQEVDAPGYGAIDFRRLATADKQERVLDSNHFQVIQRTGGAAMAVDVLTGEAFVMGDSTTDQGLYYARQATNLTGASEITIAAADGTNPRIDQIVLEIKDNAHDASGLNVARVRCVQGTPSGGANLSNRTGAAALPVSAMRLADVLVGTGVTTILTANIQDRRTYEITSGYAGVIQWTAAPTPDAGFLFCDGSAISRSSFAALFARIGTAFGVGDGSTTFNIPDLRGRMPVGLNTSNAAVNVLGEADALALANRQPYHTHTFAHTHGVAGTTLGDDPPTGTGGYGENSIGTYSHQHGLLGNTISQSTSIVSLGGPAYLTLNAQIKT